MKRFRKKIHGKVTNSGTYRCRSLRSASLFNDLLCLVGCLALAFAFVWSQKSSAQVSATTTITQGRKNMRPKRSRWAGSAQWAVQKNQDYYSDYYTGLSLGLAYTYNPRFTFYTEGGYSQPIDDNPEKLKRYGAEDLSFGVNIAPFYKNKYNFKVSASSSFSLPTSEVSKESSLNTSWNGALITSTPLQGGFRVSTIHSLSLNWYTYETANTYGTEYNYPYALTNGLTGSWNYKRFYTALSGNWTYLKNFAGTDINVQSLRSSLGFTITQKVRSEIFGKWSDRTLTNNSLFDDDRTYFGMLLTVSI